MLEVDRDNDLGPYGDDSSSDDNGSSSSLNESRNGSDSDSDTPSGGTESDDDKIDLELLQGLEDIHISVQRRTADAPVSDLLVPKGPQKTHKIRKQGKNARVPYLQQGGSGARGVGSGYPHGAVGGGSPLAYTADDRVDMVLSESLNDPGFRNNLLYTLEAEVEQGYPKTITPPLSSTDCSYTADFNSGYSSCSSGSSSSTHNSYYQQYTPESLHTASPQGSDVSIEDENFASNMTQGFTYQASASNPSPQPNDHYLNEDDPPLILWKKTHHKSVVLNDTNATGKPPSNAEKFIDNVCSGVKYFLASAKRHPGEVIDPYLTSEDRTHSLLALARVLSSKLVSLKETDNRLALANSGESGSVYEYL